MTVQTAPNAVRRLSVLSQLVVLAVAGIVLGILLIALPARVRAAAESNDAAGGPAAPPGTFQPSDIEWQALRFATASEMSFADDIATEGKIAIDGDLSADVTPPFSGRVVSVPVRAGDLVTAGQILLTAEASEVAQARTDLDAAAATTAAAETQHKIAAANAERQKALFRISGNAMRDVQQAEADLATADASLGNDRSALTAARNRLSILDADAARSPHGPAATAVIRAPIAGTVTLRQVGPGQYINATANGATTPIFVVTDTSKVWLTAEVREEDAPRMRVGLPIKVAVGGIPGRSFDATLDYVATGLDPATHRLPVHAAIDNPDGALKPEMFAQFRIAEGDAARALGVPAAAIIFEGSTARVWRVAKDHRLELRTVTAGASTDSGMVEILSGLAPGDQVVTAGALFIDRAAETD